MWKVLSWFRKKPDSDDYEQILSSLAISISTRQQRLSELRLRERRASLLVTFYSLAAWGAYLALWYGRFLPKLFTTRTRSNIEIEKILLGLPVVIGPVFIVFTRRITQLWYTRKGNAEEATLKKLLAEQRTKIEEIKKKTNYYSTRNLLERYDDSPSRQLQRNQDEQAAQAQIRQRGPRASLAQPTTPVAPGGFSRLAHSTPPPKALQYPPPTPPRKQWFDKVADALLGDDGDSGAGSPKSKYALICAKCFSHNGLVMESLWEDTQYTCPKCGHFNPSPRSQKQSNKTSNPSSNLPPLPASPPPTSTTPVPTTPPNKPVGVGDVTLEKMEVDE